MSNPYGPPSGEGEQPPPPPSYGTPPPPPPSSSPYGAPSPYGSGYGAPPPAGGGPYGGYGTPPPPGTPSAGTDGVSIAAFVLSLTCCLSVVGLIMGFFGLKRTKDGQRSGRWAAIAAIPIGILGTLLLIGSIVGVVFLSKATISLNEAKAGQCITVDDEDSDSVILYKKDCSDSHEGEIVYAGNVGADASTLEGSTATQVCVSRAESVLTEIDADKFKLHVLTKDPDNIKPDDRLVCYVTLQEGGKYKGKAADQ